MFEDQTEQAIKQRMLDTVPSDLDKREGSFVQDGISPAAFELAKAYIEMDNILRIGFAPTSYGEFLDMRAGEHGLTRKVGTKATGQVKVTGSAGAVIPTGSLFATDSEVQFATKVDATIAVATALIDVEAVDAGVKSNVPAGAITAIPVSIAGVTGVTNVSQTTGGTDTETDDDLLVRYLDKVRLPATSGNVAHYIEWAKSIAGVGDVKVFPTWAGAGTVKLVLIDSNKQPASVDIVADVQGHIDPNANGDGEGVAPIGATVTVIAAVAKVINVSATLVLDTGYTLENVQEPIHQALTNYLKGIAFKQSYVSYAQVGNSIIDVPGVLDYSNLKLNAGTANVAVGAEEVATLGTVMLA